MSNFAYLSEAERELLRQLSFPVALPRMLPQGWTAKPLDLFEDVENDEMSLDASFAGPNSAKWSVVSTVGGVGDAIPGEEDATFKLVEHSEFGQILVHFFREDDQAEVLSDWFPEAEEAPAFHSFRGAEVGEADLSALVSSIATYSSN